MVSTRQLLKGKSHRTGGWGGHNVTSSAGSEFTSQIQEAKESGHVLPRGPGQPWTLGGGGRQGPQASWSHAVSPAPSGLSTGGDLVKRGSPSASDPRAGALSLASSLGRWAVVLPGSCRSRPAGSPPEEEEVLIAEEGDSVDGKGAGTVDGEPPEEDPQSFLPGTAHHAVQQPPVGPLLQPCHLHPGLDHIQGGGGNPGGDAGKAPCHQHCARAWGQEWGGIQPRNGTAPHHSPPPRPPLPSSSLSPAL